MSKEFKLFFIGLALILITFGIAYLWNQSIEDKKERDRQQALDILRAILEELHRKNQTGEDMLERLNEVSNMNLIQGKNLNRLEHSMTLIEDKKNKEAQESIEELINEVTEMSQANEHSFMVEFALKVAKI